MVSPRPSASRRTTEERITRTGNPDGPLAGEVLVFTGALSMPRREAADMAAAVGCEVDAGVTKETTLLVVGDQDVARLAPGQTKSSKHLKAEALIAKGQPIRILRETDFRRMAAL
ncbi:MAG: BRCT domain-containing protein [Caulobacteraceae bacterium]